MSTNRKYQIQETGLEYVCEKKKANKQMKTNMRRKRNGKDSKLVV